MSENNYSPLDSDEKILEKFMKILKFYNEIIKSSPLIVSNQDYLAFKKQKARYNQEIKKLEELVKPIPKVDFDLEINSYSPGPKQTDEPVAATAMLRVSPGSKQADEPVASTAMLRVSPDLESHQVDRYVLNIPKNKKTRFNVYILKKINDLEHDLEDFLETLDYFYLKYKKHYDNFSFYNIFASSSLTLLESVSLMFRPQIYTGIVSIFISTSIAVSVAVLKLKNYKEKIEEIVKTTEKVYSCQAQLFTFDKFLKTSLNMSAPEIIPD